MQQVQLNVSDEFKAAGDAIAALVSDIKASKATAAIVSDVLPLLVSAVGGYANFAADIKIADNQTYLAYAIAKALEG